jgi:hypothetical protein
MQGDTLWNFILMSELSAVLYWLKVGSVAEVTHITCTKDGATSAESKRGRTALKLWFSLMCPTV